MGKLDLVIVALGVGCIIASAFLPSVSAQLMPTGTGLVAWALKQPSQMGKPLP